MDLKRWQWGQIVGVGKSCFALSGLIVQPERYFMTIQRFFARKYLYAQLNDLVRELGQKSNLIIY